MLNIFITLLFLYNQIICINNYNEISEESEIIEIEPGLSQTYFIKYEKETNFKFIILDEENIQINIHAINCNFNLDYNGKIINQIDLDTYSLTMNSLNNNITITPLIDIIDGKYKENYEQKSCPLLINSFYIKKNKSMLKIENKENIPLYFEPQNLELLNIIYEIKEVSNDSFITLSLQFDENVDFSININFKTDDNTISKNIQNSTNIFLNSKFLLYDNQTKQNGNLSIEIKSKNKKAINMHFKLIEKDSISLLEKNKLNYGFLTSETTYQYYYMEIFKGEEGEIMLHNKRLYGILHAKIISKKNITKDQLIDTSIYPKEDSDDSNSTYLIYNQHILQLNYSYINTAKCFDGCYLLITYEQKKSVANFTLIGYEYTIFSRTWNYTDYISQIGEIPFNEYIIGIFHKGSINHHYYSLPIPDDADKIIIQIEGNYFEGFYGEGKIKINTVKTIGNTDKLPIIKNRNVITLDLKLLNFKEKFMSFAFRPIDYFAEILSFYYFRVLYIKENDQIYYPIDSYFGNLCLPEYNNTANSYYCYLIFNNKFNELSQKFAITSSTQNEYFTIDITIVYTNGTVLNKVKEFIYLYNELTEGIDYYMFKFEFSNNNVKNIMASLCDRVPNLYPQIYSSQMFYLDKFQKVNYFDVKNNYTLTYQYLYGSTGIIKASFLNFEEFYSSRNFKGKPVSLAINFNNLNITFKIISSEYIYFYQLNYIMRNKGIEEIKPGQTSSQLMLGGHFPLYYYVKITDKNYANVDVNFRLNSYNESVLQNKFDIRGYMLDEDTIKRKINGEYINLKTPINGTYSNRLKVGLLEVNQKIDNEYNYLLIEIRNLEQEYINSYLLVELLTKENHNDLYFMPGNIYLIETFDDKDGEIRDKNEYYISINQRASTQVLIEISPDYNDIEIEFRNKENLNISLTNSRGFKKYRIWNSTTDNVYFNVTNTNKRKANYMIRYYYTDLKLEYTYILDDKAERKITYLNDDYVTVSLTFKGLVILKVEELIKRTDIYFYISGLLYNMKKNSDELINTTSILHEQIPSYENKTRHTYDHTGAEKWTLVFTNISRKNNYVYDLQLQVNAILQNNIYNEEFLIYTTKVDLTDIKLEEKKDNLWLILGIILGVIGALIIAFFIIKYIRLTKRNVNLQEEMKSMAYSNNIQKNVLIKEKTERAQSDTDYETTFI